MLGVLSFRLSQERTLGPSPLYSGQEFWGGRGRSLDKHSLFGFVII